MEAERKALDWSSIKMNADFTECIHQNLPFVLCVITHGKDDCVCLSEQKGSLTKISLMYSSLTSFSAFNWYPGKSREVHSLQHWPTHLQVDVPSAEPLPISLLVVLQQQMACLLPADAMHRLCISILPHLQCKRQPKAKRKDGVLDSCHKNRQALLHIERKGTREGGRGKKKIENSCMHACCPTHTGC